MEENKEAKEILEKVLGKNNLYFKILWLFFNQKDHQTNIARIAKKFNKSDSTVRKVMGELIESGVLKNVLNTYIWRFCN